MVNDRFSKNMHYPVQIPLCSRLHDHYIHYSIAHIHKTITITEALSQYHRLCHNTLEWPSIILGVCIHSVCLMCISMTFEATGDVCITVIRHGTCNKA